MLDPIVMNGLIIIKALRNKKKRKPAYVIKDHEIQSVFISEKDLVPT